MPKICCIPDCRKQCDHGDGLNLSFFSFPKDEREANSWKESIRCTYPSIQFVKSSFLCDLHFDLSCFQFTGLCKRLRLKKGSIPTLFNSSDLSSRQITLRQSDQTSDLEVPAQIPVLESFSDQSINLIPRIDDNTDQTPDLEVLANKKQVRLNEISHIRNEEIPVAESSSDQSSNLTPSIDDISVSTNALSLRNSTLVQEVVVPYNPHANKISDAAVETKLSGYSNTGRKSTSITKINVDSIKDIYEARKIIKKAQAEIVELKKLNKKKAMQQYRIKKKMNNHGDLLRHLKNKKFLSAAVVDQLSENVPEHARHIFQRLLKRRNPKYREPFPTSLRSFATTLHFYSPKGYEFVRQSFLKTLPHKETISKWYRKIDMTAGVHKISLEVIKRKVQDTKKNDSKKIVLCNLTFDEMKIKKQVDIIDGKEYGYVDLGEDLTEDVTKMGDEEKVATDCLVVLLVCENDRWKVPVSHYFIDSLNAKEKHDIIKENLKALHSTGVTVTSVTFDGLSANFSMCRKLGANLTVDKDIHQFYFSHPVTKKKVFIISDACHVLKLLRNALGSVVMYDRDNKIISWDYLKRLVEFQEANGLHAGNKLRRDHINFSQNIMNVRLAAQTLSRSVSDSLIYMEKDLEDPSFKGAEGTAKFCAMINDSFDIGNSRELFSKDKWKRGICKENFEEMEKKVNEIIEYVKGLRLGNEDKTLLIKSKKKTGFIGLIITLRSILDIYQYYFERENYFLLTYKLSQDHLEMLFSVFRSKGGFSNNPTCYQINFIAKKIIVHADVKSSKYANCIALDNTEILQVPNDMLASLNKKEKSETNVSQTSIDESMHAYLLQDYVDYDDEDFYGINTNKKYIDHVVAHIAGFVARFIIRRTKFKNCINCCFILMENEELNESAEDDSYSNNIYALINRKNRGGLTKPSSDLVEICKVLERQFRKLYKSRRSAHSYLRRCLEKALPRNLLIIEHGVDPKTHRDELIRHIIFHYLRLRENYFEKQRLRPIKRIRRTFLKLTHMRNE